VTGRTRRVLRRALAFLALGGFPLLVVLSYRPSGARTLQAREEVAETLLRESQGIRDRIRFEDFDYSESDGDAEVYRLRAAEAIAFAEGADRMFRLKDVTFQSRDAATGRIAVVAAPRAEFVPATKAFRVFEGVRIDGEGVGIRSVSFQYDPARRLLVSEGPVTALREGLVATALEGSVETDAGVVRFRNDVRLGGKDDRGRRFALSAQEVDLRRGGGFSARGGVVLRTDELLLRGDEAVRELLGEADRLSAHGSVRAILIPDQGGKLTTPIRAEGESLELRRDAAGAPGELLLAGLPARLDIPPEGPTGARQAVAATFEATLASGKLARVAIPGPLTLAESAPTARPGAGTPPAARLLTAGSGQLSFGPDGRTIETAVFDGGVTLSEGTRTSVRAPRATLRAVDESAVFAGTVEEPARYEDEKTRVLANVLTWYRRDERIEGTGNVKTTFRGREGAVVLGGTSTAPVSSESDFLRVTSTDRRVLLTGNVTAWQEENVLRAQSLLLDDRERSLRAEGNVRTTFRRRRVDPKTKAGIVETVAASGNVLTHREADRLLRIEGSSSVSSGSWVMKADVTDIVLGPDRTVDYAEARGSVVVEDRVDRRRGEGAMATWRPQADAITLEGQPATALDGKGNRMTGARLTFQKGSGRVDVETGPGIPSQGILRPEEM
jgi:lipopolysaccharide export system protein LptA